jgi:hypothetical protein
MNARPMWIAVVAALVASGTAATLASAGPGDDWQSLHRRLHYPHVGAHSRCPVRGSGESDGGQPLNGTGPAYLMSVGGAWWGVIQVFDPYRDAKGWLGQKTPWEIDRQYAGPLLVRGRRLDRRGPVRFAPSYGQHLRELRFPTGSGSDVTSELGPSPRFRLLATSTLFRHGGCYGLQVDGTSFSEVIVMRVVEFEHP